MGHGPRVAVVVKGCTGYGLGGESIFFFFVVANRCCELAGAAAVVAGVLWFNFSSREKRFDVPSGIKTSKIQDTTVDGI